MKRLLVFLSQLLLTFGGMKFFFADGGDGPGTGLWLVVDTIPVMLLSFVFFLISLFLQRKCRETRIVMSSIFLFIIFGGRILFFSTFWDVWIIYLILNPALPELVYLIYQIKQKPVDSN
ncbi:MAG: hypothetical protein IJS20_12290 [Bacteroidales bacterium]|nr:hypothetical protein [Bacteroidales bacterium]